MCCYSDSDDDSDKSDLTTKLNKHNSTAKSPIILDSEDDVDCGSDKVNVVNVLCNNYSNVSI